MKHALLLSGFCLLAGALFAQETNAVPLTKDEQKAFNRITMRNSRPQKRAAVHVVAPRPFALDKTEYLVPVSPVIVPPSVPQVGAATHSLPFQSFPLLDMFAIPSLMNSPSPSFEMPSVASLMNSPSTAFKMTEISSLISSPSPLFNMPSVGSLINSPSPSFDRPSVPSLIDSAKPSFKMSMIPSLIDSPKPVFVAETANLLPAYRQSLVVNKVLFTAQAIKKHDYEYRVMFREDVLEVYPMLLTRRAADQTYFGYLEFTISRALSEQNYELADKLAAQYQREWDRLKPMGTRIQRPR